MPKRIRLIYPKEGEESNMFMIEATKNGAYGLKFESPLYVHNIVICSGEYPIKHIYIKRPIQYSASGKL